MPRPRNKAYLLIAGEEYYTKLIEMADGMSEKEMNTPFNFSGDPSKKEQVLEPNNNRTMISSRLQHWEKYRSYNHEVRWLKI